MAGSWVAHQVNSRAFASTSCTDGSNVSPSAIQSEVQRNPPGLLWNLREMGAIPQLLLSNWTGESVLLKATRRLCSVFLRRASAQSGFKDSIRRMQCDTLCTHLRDAALLSVRQQQPVGNLWMMTPRAESSSSNCTTPGETSRSPGTMTAHSRLSPNSFDLISHWSKDNDFASPIWMIDQCRTNANAVASSGEGPDRMKWLFPCTSSDER